MVWSWTSPVSSSEMKMHEVSPLLFLLLGPWARGQPGARGQCPSPRECIQQAQCPAFTSQWEELKTLANGSEEYDTLLEKLQGDICDKAIKLVCCDPVNLPGQCPGSRKCIQQAQCPSSVASGRS